MPALSDVLLVARRRRVLSLDRAYPRIEDAGATFALELPDFGGGLIKGPWKLLRLLTSRRIRARFEALLCRASFTYVEAPSFDSYLIARLSKRNRRPFVIEMRGDVLFNRDYMTRRFGALGPACSLLEKALFDCVRDRAYAGVYINRDLMRRYPVGGGRGIALSDLQTVPELSGEPRRISSGAKKLLYVGHLESVKNVEVVLKALHAAGPELPPGWSLTLVGDGPERRRLESLARSLTIAPQVRFLGSMPWGERLFGIYHEAELLVISSLTESGPRVLLEGMLAGLPVLSTPVGIAPDVLDEQMIVKGWDVQSWADALIRVMSDTELLNRVASENVVRAGEFDGAELLAQRKRFYTEVIEDMCVLQSRRANGA